MKSIVLLTLFIVGFVSAISAKESFKTKVPVLTFNPEPGYITINEFTGGFGLVVTSTPYSKGFFGFTTLHGYQVNKTLVVSLGTGLNFYNDGVLMPLFLDLRYRIYVSRFTPYVFGEGGFLFDYSAKKDTRVFISPGAGVSYTIKRNLAVNLGTGLFVQWGTRRDAYFILKGGVVYKF